MSSIPKLKKWFEENKNTIQEDFFSFLRFASISTDPAYKEEMKKCARWLEDYINSNTDLKAKIIQTEGAELVFAEKKAEGPKILIYGHYDVQPVDPLDLWESDPFDPQIRDGSIFARGAVDDKGQIFYAIIAMRALKELGIQTKASLKFCIEGEEESASVGLSKSLPSLKDQLSADELLVIDFNQFDASTPALTLGARGIAAFEVILTGSNGDLHSGMLGGIAYNPLRALCEILGKVFDSKGQVQIENFYEDVKDVTSEEMKTFAFASTEEELEKDFSLKALGGETEKTLKERNGFQPTFEINGISGGYAGAGFKTVIPARAIAKLSCRLVPDQDPKKIAKQVEHFIKKNTPKGMEVEVNSLGGEKAFRGSLQTHLAKAVRDASEEVCGKTCKNIVSGGSIPIVQEMCEILGLQVTGMGYGLPTDQVHAPNEHFDIKRFELGYLTVARAVELL